MRCALQVTAGGGEKDAGEGRGKGGEGTPRCFSCRPLPPALPDGARIAWLGAQQDTDITKEEALRGASRRMSRQA